MSIFVFRKGSEDRTIVSVLCMKSKAPHTASITVVDHLRLFGRVRYPINSSHRFVIREISPFERFVCGGVTESHSRARKKHSVYFRLFERFCRSIVRSYMAEHVPSPLHRDVNLSSPHIVPRFSHHSAGDGTRQSSPSPLLMQFLPTGC